MSSFIERFGYHLGIKYQQLVDSKLFKTKVVDGWCELKLPRPYVVDVEIWFDPRKPSSRSWCVNFRSGGQKTLSCEELLSWLIDQGDTKTADALLFHLELLR